MSRSLRKSSNTQSKHDIALDDSNEVIESSPDSHLRRSPRKRSGNFDKIMKAMRSPGSEEDDDEEEEEEEEERKREISAERQRLKQEKIDRDMEKIEKEFDELMGYSMKSSELFDKSDVNGEKIYSFQASFKKNGMVQKALAVSNTPKNKTLPRIVIKKLPLSKTNKNIPSKQNTPIKKRQLDELSESESVSEDSEFIPSGSDDESDHQLGSDVIDSDVEEEITTRKSEVKRQMIPITPCRRGRSRNQIQYRDYHIKTDDYFESQSEKIVTSNHTLNRLKNPRLDEKKLQNLLNNQSHISSVHQRGICSLTENCKMMFPMWYHILEEGYSLLLHGLGSKRNLINDFHKEVVNLHPTVIVNGFFPSLTIKDILDGIITELMEIECSVNVNEYFDVIKKSMDKNPDSRLYLLIHNIDGVMLRPRKSQDILSRLSAIPNVHLIASVDHINAPLLWDNVQRSRYNFYWWDATSFLPYEAETSYESSLLVQQSGALELSSLKNVFASLTTNAKAIYNILIKYQIDNEKTNCYTGMAFKDLYRSAREAFLVNSDVALRAQLTEFIDHKLVKTKRNIDGAEYLIIPLDNSLLKKFLEFLDEQLKE